MKPSQAMIDALVTLDTRGVTMFMLLIKQQTIDAVIRRKLVSNDNYEILPEGAKLVRQEHIRRRISGIDYKPQNVPWRVMIKRALRPVIVVSHVGNNVVAIEELGDEKKSA